MIRRAIVLLLVGLAAVSILPNSTARSQTAGPSASTSSTQPFFDWRETVRLEHVDRMRRFERLAAQGLIGSPAFYEALISKQDLKAFGLDIPVLRIVFPQRVFFDTDKSEIRPEGNQVVDIVAADLRKDVPDVAVFIAGHTDSRGSDEYNYALSVRRADAVARALFSRGIGNSSLWRVGFGKAVPIKPNTTPDNMAQNRRVEFLFAAKADAIAVWLS